MQRLIALAFCILSTARCGGGAAERPFDPSSFVVVGEGLAAGLGDFGLAAQGQEGSFPALLAARLGADFPQPLFQPPGLGGAPGLAPLPAVVPDLQQTTVLATFPPPAGGHANLAVPGFTVADALGFEPRPPVVHRDDPKRTIANFVFGLPGLTAGEGDLPTQVEAAKRRRPTLALVELGYAEAVAAATAGDAGKLPEPSRFRADYTRLLGELGEEGTTVIATTIPDPLDTAWSADLAAAARLLRTEPAFLAAQYGLAEGDRLTLAGLYEAGYQFAAREIRRPLPPGSVLSTAAAAALRDGVAALNREIAGAAADKGARVYDLGGFFKKVAGGIDSGGRRLDASYLGGFYGLNGLYPGTTGHALIAADLLAWLNGELGTSYPAIDVAAAAAKDPNLLAQLAPGATATDAYLAPRTPADLPPPPRFDPAPKEFPIQTTYPGLQPGKDKCQPLVGVPACGLSNPELTKPLTLPAGLEQTLPLNPAGSYFGDALRAVDCPDDTPLFPNFPPFGTCANVLFGGLALTDTPVQGQVTIKFSPPDAKGVSHFEVSHGQGLFGQNGPLVAPQLFKLPSQLNAVLDVPGLPSSGDLDLNTGIVTNLHYNVVFFNTAIQALFGVNPKLPAVPMLFPGPPNGGSSWGRFTQRPDGKLDFTFAGNLFLPLGLDVGGDPVRFPLPFCNPQLQCASVVTRGLTLHPHLHLTTQQSPGPACGDDCPEIPTNAVAELAPFVHNTSFGDVFGVKTAEMGGPGTGRSHLMGRLKVQWGARFGDAVPFAVWSLPPGGLLSADPKPFPYIPRGSSRSMIGFNEILRFPKLEYDQSNLASGADPFNLSVGAVDLKTGQVIGELLHRAFVEQALFIALATVEPCTPADSFCYQGASSFEKGAGGQTILRFDGGVYLPYPEGFKFPSPDGKTGFVAQAGSRLDPFLRFQAMTPAKDARAVVKGEGSKVSSIGQPFSYRYEIACDGSRGSFEYANETDGGTFELTGLSWVACTNARGSQAAAGSYDTVTFTGFGTWSKDPGGAVHQVSAQFSNAAQAPYAGITVDGGTTSNVNTKPPDIEDTLP